MGKIIINADDYGISHRVNEAVKRGMLKGIIDRATIMVNMPFVDEALTLAKENNYFSKIGLHLNLVEGKPLTEGIKNTWLCDNGLFNGKISKNKYKTSLITDRTVLKCIEEEIDAQMKKFIAMGLPLHHLDSHQHSHIKPSIFPIIYKLAKTNHFYSIRLASLISSDNPKLGTKVYKEIINARIKRYNKENKSYIRYPLMDAGCAYLSLKNQNQQDKGKYIRNHNIEMWFHPAMAGEEIINLFCNEPFDIQDLINFKSISAEIEK